MLFRCEFIGCLATTNLLLAAHVLYPTAKRFLSNLRRLLFPTSWGVSSTELQSLLGEVQGSEGGGRIEEQRTHCTF